MTHRGQHLREAFHWDRDEIYSQTMRTDLSDHSSWSTAGESAILQLTQAHIGDFVHMITKATSRSPS